MQLKNQKIWTLSALALFAIAYGLVVLWYVPTQPMLPLGCLLGEPGDSQSPGIVIRDASGLESVKCQGNIPDVGDRIIEVAGRPIHSFTDWVRVHRSFRSLKIGSEAMLQFGTDPTEERNLGTLSVVEYPDKARYVKVWFIRANGHEALLSFIPLVPQASLGVSTTLLWYLLQIFIVVISGIAYWNRPLDQPVRTFFALSFVTMLAFVGGSHWWVIAGSPYLVSIFAISGCLLPAVLLHFLTVYPFPTSYYVRARFFSLTLIYLIPAIIGMLITAQIFVAWLLTRDLGSGPFAVTVERLLAQFNSQFLPIMRATIVVAVGISLVYFSLCVFQLIRGYRVARNPLEKDQVKWILIAAVIALFPIGYTIYLAAFEHVRFALGASRSPMLLASFSFMLAYAIGIARYKLMLIDQVVSRGAIYYGSSFAILLIFSALIAVGAVNALRQDLAIFGRTAPIILVFMTAILVLSWLRDTVQRSLDRRFFSEKYQLDKALRRMNRVVSDVLEPEEVSASLLDSCREVMQVSEAALYIRRKESNEFRMLMASGQSHFPVNVTVSEEAVVALQSNRVLQRVPQMTSPSQKLIRELKAEVIHGLEIQDRLGGILVLGPKPNHTQFTAEDIAFVIAMARTTAIAMHCATVQRDVSRLNQDLQLKTEKISDQERLITSLQQELSVLSRAPVVVEQKEEFDRAGIIGESPAILDVLETVRKVASSHSSVLIRGESGTGKELLARAIHVNSSRKSRPMISVNCAALSPTLLESELFGHVKGAFTDAREDKVGRFQLADGGTLFLDEIGDISLDVQVKLLRVLQERTFEPVGSTKSVQVDVRVVAATHQNLEQLISSGKFREDLFYRLNVISMTLPPLRERPEDLLELASHFLRSSSEKSGKHVIRIERDALDTLQRHDWPGNIRELQNVMERAVVLADSHAVRKTDLPKEVLHPEGTSPRQQGSISLAPAQHSQPVRRSQKKSLSKEDEINMLMEALEQCDGNKAEAARLVGMPRSTFYSKLKKYELQ